MPRRLTLEQIQENAKEKGGECLSKKYINITTKLKFKCKKGHIFEITPGSVRQGQWCRKCFNLTVGDRTRLSIEHAQKLAKKKKGKCLSTIYIGNHKLLKWQCKEGHIFQNTLSHVQNGEWCRKCAGLERLTIKQMQQLSIEREGLCLSKEYKNIKTNLQWQCKRGHTWFAQPGNVIKKTWCPYCNRNLNEEECRRIFQEIYNRPFPYGRPKWLISDKNWQMEFDGYNEELKIAFEYDDKDHRRIRTQKLDKIKEKLCKKHKVLIIRISHTVNYDNFKKYILKKLKESGKWMKNKKL